MALTTYNDPDGGTLKFYLPVRGQGRCAGKGHRAAGHAHRSRADKTDQPDVYKVDFPIKPGETNFEVTYLVPYSSGAVYEGKVPLQDRISLLC